jgi:hypothetical protein
MFTNSNVPVHNASRLAEIMSTDLDEMQRHSSQVRFYFAYMSRK